MDLNPQLIWDRVTAIPGLKDSHLAALSGIDRSYFSRIRSGALGFTYPQFKTLETLLTNLEELKSRAGDLPVDYSNIGAVKVMLENLEHERRNPPPAPTPEDFELMSAVCNDSESYGALAERFGFSKEQLNARLNEANRRIAFVLNRIGQEQQVL